MTSSDSKLALSHVDASANPRMVDVSHKHVSVRTAQAEAWVKFPTQVATQLREQHLQTAKGSIVQTAIIAGTMASKKTADLIPFCHPLAIDQCRIEIEWEGERSLRILAHVKCEAKTGVEMEALTAASVAALCVYDMTKALSHAIEIGPIRLLSKSGGKSEFCAAGAAES